jgi:hypothetical protein
MTNIYTTPAKAQLRTAGRNVVDTRSWGINANARPRGTVNVTIPEWPGGSM